MPAAGITALRTCMCATLPIALCASMPTYVYRFVDTGETIEVQQSFADGALTEAAIRPAR